LKNRLTKNYLYNLIYNALNIVVPMITVPYVTRIILPAQMGVFSTAMSIFTIVVIVARFGVLTYGTRAIAMVHDDKAKMLDNFRRIFSTQVVTTILFLIPAVILSLMLTGGSQLGWIYAVNAFVILNATVDISWFYNGLEEFRITITRNIFVKIIAVVLIFLLVKTRDDIVIYALIYVCAAFIGNLTMFFGVKRFAGTFRIFSFKWIKLSVIKEAIPFMVPIVLIIVFVETSRYFIYGISGEATTGIYDQALKVVRMLIILTSALVTVVTPRMAKFVAAQNFDSMKSYFVKIFIILAFQTVLIFSGVIVVGNEFVSFFFGAEYADVAPVLQILAIYPFLFMLEQVSLSLILRPLGNTKIMLIAILISLGVNVALNAVLVPLWGVAGGVISLLIATLVHAAIQAYNVRAYIRWRPILKNTVIMIIAAGVTTVAIIVVKKYISFGSLADFFVFGTVCVVLYSGIVMLLSKDIRRFTLLYVHRFIDWIRRRKDDDLEKPEDKD
jgi:O-antigen/teichoic acid export membrane protein